MSLDALLIRHLRAVCEGRKIKWALLLHADAQPPASTNGQRLRLVVDEALVRVLDELLALDLGDRPLLLHDAGLLAHYDRLGILDRVRDAVSAGRLRARCGWVLVANDDHRPVVDHRVVPVATLAQVAHVSGVWVGAQRALAGDTAAAPGAA